MVIHLHSSCARFRFQFPRFCPLKALSMPLTCSPVGSLPWKSQKCLGMDFSWVSASAVVAFCVSKTCSLILILNFREVILVPLSLIRIGCRWPHGSSLLLGLWGSCIFYKWQMVLKFFECRVNLQDLPMFLKYSIHLLPMVTESRYESYHILSLLFFYFFIFVMSAILSTASVGSFSSSLDGFICVYTFQKPLF